METRAIRFTPAYRRAFFDSCWRPARSIGVTWGGLIIGMLRQRHNRYGWEADRTQQANLDYATGNYWERLEDAQAAILRAAEASARARTNSETPAKRSALRYAA